MLSVLIPARNEFLLKATIESALKASRGDIEIVAVLDGYWPEPNIVDDKRVTLVHHTEPIGQRAAINEAARIAKGKYILKTDAHSMFDKGFDVKLAEDCEYDWTVLPRMYNLHAFDHVCEEGHRFYQDKFDHKKENVCPDCQKPLRVEMVWKPRKHRRTDYMNFGNDMVVKYWRGYEKRPEAEGDITDVMNGVGACWFMHKDRFWELGGMDEGHGSWGQVGVEVALKAWLSGGRHVVNKKTWFAHMFRTTGAFGFPYEISGTSQNRARAYSKDLWTNNRWNGQGRNFNWVLEKFAPVPGWETDTTIIYITDNSLSDEIAEKTKQNIKKAAKAKPIVSVSQKPIDFGENICVGEIGRTHLSLFKQLLVGVEAVTTKYIAVAEHDCLYPPGHFNFKPPKDDVFYYNKNRWIAQWHGKTKGQYSRYRSKALSCLVCGREILIEALKDRIKALESGYSIRKKQSGACEPGSCDNLALDGVDNILTEYKADDFLTEHPVLDIRHSQNYTGGKWSKNVTYYLPYWGSFYKVMGTVPKCRVYQKGKKGRFRDKGRWNNFIKPLIPFTDYEDRTFVDMGCAEGMYLNEARNMGFGAIFGIEERESAVRYAAWKYGEALLRKKVGKNFKQNNVPMADLTLLSCFHYWLEPDALKRYVDGLANKSLYVLVVGTERVSKKHASNPNSETLKKVFAGWEIVSSIKNISRRGDPAPRSLYSILFKSPILREYSMDWLWPKQQFVVSRRYLPSYSDFVQQIITRKKFDYTKTAFYDYWAWRKPHWRPSRIKSDVERWAKLTKDVCRNGLRDALAIRGNGRLKDGMHRLIIAKQLGKKHVICKRA